MVCHLSLASARLVHSVPTHPSPISSISTLSSHHPRGLLSHQNPACSSLLPNTLHMPQLPHPLQFITLLISSDRSTNHEASNYVVFSCLLSLTLSQIQIPSWVPFLTLPQSTVSSLNVRNKASHPHKTGKTTVPCILIFMLLHSEPKYKKSLAWMAAAGGIPHI